MPKGVISLENLKRAYQAIGKAQIIKRVSDSEKAIEEIIKK